jgi:FkbM family methyltransferase
LLGQHLEPGNLVSVEAHPANARSLKQNLSLNGIQATVVQKALADTETHTEFSLSHGQVGEFIRGADYNDGVANTEARTVEVETVSGDSLVSECGCPSPSVIRLDVTGAEPQALDGMTTVLSDERCRLVYVYLYPERYENPHAVEARLDAHEFEMTSTDRWLRAERPSAGTNQ